MAPILCNVVLKPKLGYKKLKEILHGKTFPVTIDINCLDRKAGAKENGRFTIHHKKDISILKCLSTDGTLRYVSDLEKNESKYTIINIDNDKVFYSIEEVKRNKKEFDICYFVSTRKVCYGKDTFFPGQIFCFVTQNTKLLSFRREKVRGVHIHTYPNMKKVFLPLETEGEFKRCTSPNEAVPVSIFTVLKEYNSQFILTETSSAKIETFYVAETTKIGCIFASKKSRGSLAMHVFSMTEFSHAKILTETAPVDILDDDELAKVLQATKHHLSSEHIFHGFYKTFTYTELTLTRLLDEILLELSQKLPPVSRSQQVIPIPYQSKKRVSIAQKIGIERNETKSLMNSCLNKKHENENFYENNNSLNDAKKKELFVEFDNGGYVVIPYVGNQPKIKFDNLYHCTDNVAYNYGYCEENSYRKSGFEDHDYAYISDDEIDGTKFRSRLKTFDSTDSNVTNYDYSQVRQFRLPAVLSKQYLKDSSCDEVLELLEANQLKSHVTVFKDNNIDGKKLISLDKDLLQNLHLNLFEIEKLTCFIKGWRSLKNIATNSTWLTRLACDWSIHDVSKYLLHVNMRSFQRFASCQQIDGFFLQHIIQDDDIIQTLKTTYGVTLNDKDVERLRALMLDDGKPKFKYMR